MNTEFKKGFFGFGLGILLFYIAYRAFTIQEDPDPVQPEITNENINTAATAFQAALADGADGAKIAELNKEFAKQFGVRLVLLPGGKIQVNDLAGKTVQTI